MSKLTQPIRARKQPSGRLSVPAVLLGVGIIAVMVLALLWSNIFPTASRTENSHIRTQSAMQNSSTALLGKSSAQPRSAPSSSELAPSSKSTATPSSADSASKDADAAAQKMRADELARQQAALDAMAAQQVVKEKELAAAQQEVEQHQKEVQAQEAATLKKQQALEAVAAATPAKPVYHGPSSGEIVWEGTVSGNTLVTITGNVCDSGKLLSGGLPGVPIIIQPKDQKTRVASTPAPSNSYQRLVFGVSGHGTVQVVLQWSRS